MVFEVSFSCTFGTFVGIRGKLEFPWILSFFGEISLDVSNFRFKLKSDLLDSLTRVLC